MVFHQPGLELGNNCTLSPVNVVGESEKKFTLLRVADREAGLPLFLSNSWTSKKGAFWRFLAIAKCVKPTQTNKNILFGVLFYVVGWVNLAVGVLVARSLDRHRQLLSMNAGSCRLELSYSLGVIKSCPKVTGFEFGSLEHGWSKLSF